MPENLTKPIVLMIAPYPPPIGGISIHVERLIMLLSQDIEIKILDISNYPKKETCQMRFFNFKRIFSLLNNSHIWYVHCGNRSLGKICLIMSMLFRKKTILTLHGFGNKFDHRYGFLTNFIFRITDQIIIVNKDIHLKNVNSQSNIIYLPAFIPPTMTNENSLPDDLLKLISHKKNTGYIVLSANASKIDITTSNDVYGLNTCIDLAKSFKINNKKYFIIFIITDLKVDAITINAYLQIINSNQLDKHIMLYVSLLSFVKLIEISDAILRPTQIDGDSITVREALFLNKPVFASDIVFRPPGVLLYKQGDVRNLYDQIEKYFNNNMDKEIEACMPKISLDAYRNKYLSIINKVIQSKKIS